MESLTFSKHPHWLWDSTTSKCKIYRGKGDQKVKLITYVLHASSWRSADDDQLQKELSDIEAEEVLNLLPFQNETREYNR
jgi:hypothetical protein